MLSYLLKTYWILLYSLWNIYKKNNGKSEVKLNINRTRFLFKLSSGDHYTRLLKLANSIYKSVTQISGFPDGSDSKESACNVEDLALIPGAGRSLEKGMVIHSSILAWRIPWTEEPGKATVHGVTKSRTRLSNSHIHTLSLMKDFLKTVNKCNPPFSRATHSSLIFHSYLL